jgi:hypothetical protein
MVVPVKIEEILPAQGEVEEHKKELIFSLPAQVQEDRKAFLRAITQWLETRRSAG